LRYICGVLMMLLISAPLPARADMVLQWNEYALDAIRTGAAAPPVASRALAMMHGAIYDSVNSITQSYTPYKFQIANVKNALPEAAVVSAGYTILTRLFPDQSFKDLYRDSLATLPKGPDTNRGLQIGTRIANSMLQWRRFDGSTDFYPYTPTNPPVPGHWQPTPPAKAPFLLPQWGDVTPFTMTSKTQFLQMPPPALDSVRYTNEFNEVKSLGALNSLTRTADQTQIARFWADGAGTETPPGHWNSIAQTVAQSKGTSLEENARLFALLNLAEADAAITAWYMKRDYDFWRPLTGIREADTDGNPDTIADPTWTPLLNTPPFPSYVSGHSTYSGAGAAILAELFGDNTAFSSTSDNPLLAGVTRSYDSFSEAALEAGRSRIYGGIHWECDNEFGLKAGKGVGEYIFDNFLNPLEIEALSVGTDVQVVITPLPGTLSLSLLGFSTMWLATRRRQKRQNKIN
jgi:hypothetical protein